MCRISLTTGCIILAESEASQHMVARQLSIQRNQCSCEVHDLFSWTKIFNKATQERSSSRHLQIHFPKTTFRKRVFVKKRS
jgi:hypothetical protein